MAQILADERPLTDVIRSLDQVYLNAATLNVSSYQQQSLDTVCLERQQSARSGRSLIFASSLLTLCVNILAESLTINPPTSRPCRSHLVYVPVRPEATLPFLPRFS